jgi:WD40 repeat protein
VALGRMLGRLGSRPYYGQVISHKIDLAIAWCVDSSLSDIHSQFTSCSSSKDDKTVRIRDVETGNPVGEPLHGHTIWVKSVAFSSDGKCVVSGSFDRTIRRHETT